MANHHDDGNPELRGALLEQFRRMQQKGDAMTPNATLSALRSLGKLDDHPAGMYGPEDEGAMQFAVGSDHQNEKVVLDFGSAVKWMAMDPQQAVHLAESLIEQARRATHRPLKITIE